MSTAQNMSGPGGIGYGPERHAANGFAVCVAGDADDALGLRVVRLELVVVERPVDDVGAVDRPELRGEPEVDLAEARELAVGVEPAAADGRRQVVHLAGEDPVAVGVAVAERARLEQRVGAEEVAAGRT